MGFFNTILEKLGLKKDKPAAPSASSPKPGGVGAAGSAAGAREVAPGQYAPNAPRAVSEVDVVKHLEQLSKGKSLNWKVSIVDLLKLLDIDSSREARNELAKELGCPADLMSDSAKMNVWLHKTVLKKIAENGGNIPQSLLD
ncbi:MAG TPA: DUF3597 domain-containing protein [Anaerolineales bacterium]|jgi:hypothetical protein|nr:DUF3597 domain-containing protein [Anaerolineales bacterium]